MSLQVKRAYLLGVVLIIRSIRMQDVSRSGKLEEMQSDTSNVLDPILTLLDPTSHSISPSCGWEINSEYIGILRRLFTNGSSRVDSFEQLTPRIKKASSHSR